MIDTAAMRMGKGEKCVAERICGVDDNMVQPHFHPFIELYYLRKGQRVSVPVGVVHEKRRHDHNIP